MDIAFHPRLSIVSSTHYYQHETPMYEDGPGAWGHYYTETVAHHEWRLIAGARRHLKPWRQGLPLEWTTGGGVVVARSGVERKDAAAWAAELRGELTPTIEAQIARWDAEEREFDAAIAAHVQSWTAFRAALESAPGGVAPADAWRMDPCTSTETEQVVAATRRLDATREQIEAAVAAKREAEEHEQEERAVAIELAADAAIALYSGARQWGDIPRPHKAVDRRLRSACYDLSRVTDRAQIAALREKIADDVLSFIPALIESQ